VSLPDDLRALAARVSNWGRWGPGDERGTLNHIDAAAVRRGAAAVRRGAAFSLSIPMDTRGPQTGRIPGRENPRHEMLVTGWSVTGDPGDFTTSDDKVTTGLQSATHWDALAHVGYDGLLYNGVPMEAVDPQRGATRLGIERFGPVASRGVVCDVARLHGVETFDDPYPITGEDLEACAAAAGLTVEAGDVLLVRTGQMHWLRVGERHRYADVSPGVGVGAVEWLADHRVAAVATDTHTFEPYPPERPDALFCVHMLLLRDLGMPQGQQWDLDALAADCAAEGSWDCLLVATPLPVTGGCGGLVAPPALR
jgi:kynurenine formamidase